MKRYGFIYNPVSHGGRNSAYENLREIISGFNDAPLVRAEVHDDIRELAEKMSEEVDIVVACGGDGTVQKVASGLLYSDSSLGIIPLGNGNDLIKSLEIPSGMAAAARILKRGEIRPFDVGQCNNTIFVNTLGFGFDGLANHYAGRMGGVLRYIRYPAAALKAVFTHIPFNVTITENGESFESRLIMVTAANGRAEGGIFWIAPEASVRDGLLDLVMIKPVQRWKLPFLLPLFCMRKPRLTKAYSVHRVESCEIRFEYPVAVHLDGEMLNTTESTFHISVLPGALNIIGR